VAKIKVDVAKSARTIRVCVSYSKVSGVNLALDSQLDQTAIKHHGMPSVGTLEPKHDGDRRLTFDFVTEASANAFADEARAMDLN